MITFQILRSSRLEVFTEATESSDKHLHNVLADVDTMECETTSHGLMPELQREVEQNEGNLQSESVSIATPALTSTCDNWKVSAIKIRRLQDNLRKSKKRNAKLTQQLFEQRMVCVIVFVIYNLKKLNSSVRFHM